MTTEQREPLGDRMKRYERKQRTILSPRSYSILRVDIRAGHSYLRHAARPYDLDFMSSMDTVAEALCEEVAGAQVGYTQSDEISVIYTDFARSNTEPWFGGVVQKQVSIGAAIATARLNELRPGRRVLFDARVFTVPSAAEAANYLIWRQRDAERNSVSMAARASFSHASLLGAKVPEMRTRLTEAGQPWEALPAGFRLGRATRQQSGLRAFSYVRRDTGSLVVGTAERSWWETGPAEHFEFGDLVAALPERDEAADE